MADRLGDILALLERIAAAVEAPPAEALDAASAAKLLGISRSKFYSVEHTLPAAVDVGGCKRWLKSELTAWLKAGAPSRPAWLQIRASALRRAG